MKGNHDEKTMRVFKWLEVKYPGLAFVLTAGQYSRVDGLAVHLGLGGNTMAGIYEAKCRNTLPDQHTEYLIDEAKIEAICRLSHLLQTDAYLVVCFADGSIYRWKIAERGWLIPEEKKGSLNGKPVIYLPNQGRELLGYLPDAA